jgi:hypothetical protein
MIEMVDRSNSQVTHYNVVNYCDYQAQEAIEVTEAGQVSKQKLDTNNNINKGNKVNKQNENDSPKGESNVQKKFEPPTVEEVAAYCRDRNNGIDAQRFCDYYDARGWKPKGYTTTMKSWKAAVRTWEKPKQKESAAGGYRRIV